MSEQKHMLATDKELTRAACAILRTDAPLSAAFRNQVADALEAAQAAIAKAKGAQS